MISDTVITALVTGVTVYIGTVQISVVGFKQMSPCPEVLDGTKVTLKINDSKSKMKCHEFSTGPA